MKYFQIEYAVVLAYEHNFSRAAERLYISQPALSAQIANLEEELGVSLFERTNNGVYLTECGTIFCQKAKDVIAAWESLEDAMWEYQEQPTGKLTIGIGTRVYTNYLMDDISSYFEQHRNIDVTFISDDTGDIWSDLVNKKLDIVLDRLPPDNVKIDQKNMAVWELITERSCFLLSPDDEKSNCKELSYDDLKGYSLVSAPEGSRLDENMIQDCIDFQIPINHAYRSNNMADIMSKIREGKGFLVGPKSFGSYYQVAAIPKKPETYSALSFICLNQRRNNPMIKDFRLFLQNLCEERGLFKEQAQKKKKLEKLYRQVTGTSRCVKARSKG